MNSGRVMNLRVTIPAESRRLNVGKDVIRILGSPAYICVLQRKDRKSIAITPCAAEHPMSFKVPDKLLTDGQCRMMVNGIQFIKLIRKYKDCETLTDEMLYELVEKVVIHSASGGRTIYRQQQIDIYFNFIGDTFPSQIEISHGDKKNLTEQQLAKRKKYQKTSGKNRKKKRAALREAAKTDPQAAAEYEALLQKGRERCRKYAQNKKLAQQEPADTVPIQFEPSFETPEEMKGESA